MALATFTKPRVYGPPQLSKLDRMGIRFFVTPDDEFVGPKSQTELDTLINKATAKVHKKYEGHDDLVTKAARVDELEAENATLRSKEPKPKKDDETKPEGLAPEEIDKRIKDAVDKGRAEERAELALERATDALDKALANRAFEPSKILGLDRTQFVKDGAVDHDAIKAWVKENSTEAPKPRPFDRGQGTRNGSETGTVQAGRDAYKPRNSKK